MKIHALTDPIWCPASNTTSSSPHNSHQDPNFLKLGSCHSRSSVIIANLTRQCAGFRSTRRTKIICTIGPRSCSEEMLQTLAINGMNVARLNMCHGTHEWHHDVIERIRKLNKENG